MARGRLLKSKVREAKAVAKATAEGTAEGQVAGHKKKPLQESLREHIGKILDTDGIDAILYAGLAYAGYERSKDWKGALIGPVALKLATSDTEVAATVGIATLAMLGLSLVAVDSVAEPIKKAEEAIKQQTDALRSLIAASEADAPMKQLYLTLVKTWNWATHTLFPKSYCEWYAETFPNEKTPTFCLVR